MPQIINGYQPKNDFNNMNKLSLKETDNGLLERDSISFSINGKIIPVFMIIDFYLQ